MLKLQSSIHGTYDAGGLAFLPVSFTHRSCAGAILTYAKLPNWAMSTKCVVVKPIPTIADDAGFLQLYENLPEFYKVQEGDYGAEDPAVILCHIASASERNLLFTLFPSGTQCRIDVNDNRYPPKWSLCLGVGRSIFLTFGSSDILESITRPNRNGDEDPTSKPSTSKRPLPEWFSEEEGGGQGGSSSASERPRSHSQSKQGARRNEVKLSQLEKKKLLFFKVFPIAPIPMEEEEVSTDCESNDERDGAEYRGKMEHNNRWLRDQQALSA